MLKPPVKLDDLTEEWLKDSSIDETEAAKELARIPTLHSKYLNILSYHRLMSNKIMADYTKLKRVKYEYYRGDLNNPEDLQKYNLEPFDKKLGKEIGLYLDGDDDLNKLLIKKVIHDEIVDYCNAIIKEIGNRTWQLKSIVDWEKIMRPNG